MPRYRKGMRPWERASLLARKARAEWNLDNEPISNMRLADLFRINDKLFSRPKTVPEVPMSLGLHNTDNSLDVYLAKRPGTSRRFSACRVLGQWLEAEGNTERLIPVAEAKTAQQQFQRAFAQEFLCPYEALMDRLQTDRPTAEDIDEAAEYFGVSPLLVRTTLVNNGEMDREALKWVG